MTPIGAAIERSTRAQVALLFDAIRDIPEDVFNTWKPAAATDGSHEMNTFAALATHTVAAAEFHALHMVGGAPSDRDRPTEFHATATVDAITARFGAFLDDLHALLDSMSGDDFGGAPLPDRPDLGDWTKADWLMHTIDHIALHAGHLQIQRQLWEHERVS